MQLMMFGLFRLRLALELGEVHPCLDPDELVAEYRSNAVIKRKGNEYRQPVHRRAAVPGRQDLALAGVPQSPSHRRDVSSAGDRRARLRSGLRGGAQRVRAERRRRARARRVAVDQCRGAQRGRRVGRAHRHRADPAVGARQRSCACSRAPRASSRSRRCGRSTEASSTSTRRWPRTGPSSRPKAKATFRCAGCSRTKPACPAIATRMRHGSLSDWDAMNARARRAGAVVGARHHARIPRRDLRPPHR